MKQCVILTFAAVLATAVAAQEKGGVDVTGPYDVVAGWLKPVEEGRLLHPVAVFAETADRIFIASTGSSPKPAPGAPRLGTFDPKVPGAKLNHQLIIVDRNGKPVEEWAHWSDLFGSLHKVGTNPYDPEKHIWIVDRAAQQVLKFTNDGKKLVMALGEKGVAGSDDKHFGRPTDIAWLPDGTFFISDGYDNTRVVKFDKNGKFLMTWGAKGTGPGQFNGVHSIAVDGKRRVLVVDRGNRRVQIFDENGTYLEEWPGFVSPTRIAVMQDQTVWLSDGGGNRMAKYDNTGKLLTYWGTQGSFPGGMAGPHDFSVDPEGNLYVSNGLDHRVDKYVPKKNADRSRLVGQRFK